MSLFEINPGEGVHPRIRYHSGAYQKAGMEEQCDEIFINREEEYTIPCCGGDCDCAVLTAVECTSAEDGTVTFTVGEDSIVADLGCLQASLVDNLDGTYTHTSMGVVTIIDTTGESGNTTYNLVDNSDGTISLVGSDLTDVQVDICNIISTNCSDSVVDNLDGTYTHTSVDGNIVIIDTNCQLTVNAGTTAPIADNSLGTATVDCGDTIHFWSSDGSVDIAVSVGSAVIDLTTTAAAGNTSVVTDTIVGNLIATHDDGTGTTVSINETVTTYVDNGDGTYTYTSEDGTQTTTAVPGAETVTTLVDNLDGTYTYTSENATVTVITTCCPDATQILTSGDFLAPEAPLQSEVDTYVTNNGPFQPGTQLVYTSPLGRYYHWTMDPAGDAIPDEFPYGDHTDVVTAGNYDTVGDPGGSSYPVTANENDSYWETFDNGILMAVYDGTAWQHVFIEDTGTGAEEDDIITIGTGTIGDGGDGDANNMTLVAAAVPGGTAPHTLIKYLTTSESICEFVYILNDDLTTSIVSVTCQPDFTEVITGGDYDVVADTGGTSYPAVPYENDTYWEKFDNGILLAKYGDAAWHYQFISTESACTPTPLDVVSFDAGTNEIEIAVQGGCIASWEYQVTGLDGPGGAIVQIPLVSGITTLASYTPATNSWTGLETVALGTIDAGETITITSSYTDCKGNTCGPFATTFTRN